MPTNYYYNLYGVTIQSEIECPELLPEQGPPEASIILGKIPEKYVTETESPYFWKVTPEYFFFALKKKVRFLVTNGNKILIEIRSSTDPDEVRLFLLGTCLAVLMRQRGLFLIHGSGIATDKGCIIFSGQVGAGKSTIAAAFMEKGYQIVADDICAVSLSGDYKSTVYPGYPQLKLHTDSLLNISRDTKQLHSVSADADKFRLPIAGEFHKAPLPLRAIYFLDKHTKKDFSLTPISGTKKFQLLASNIYRPNLINDLGLQNISFKQCATISTSTPAYHFKRPEDSFNLKLDTDFIERSFKEIESHATVQKQPH